MENRVTQSHRDEKNKSDYSAEFYSRDVNHVGLAEKKLDIQTKPGNLSVCTVKSQMSDATSRPKQIIWRNLGSFYLIEGGLSILAETI